MKVILASSGFTNEQIIQACEQLAGKSRQEINFAIINEAIKVETGDHRWFAESLMEITGNFGGSVEFVDLQAHPLDYILSRLQVADVIFCFGGNTDYLTKVFEQTGFAEKLPEILQEKVWVGSSAGSCVLCHRESKDTAENIFTKGPDNDHNLNLLPIFFLPHFHSDWFPQLKEDVAIKESKATDLPVYLMSGQSAVIVTGDMENPEFRPIGTDYVVVRDGERQAISEGN